MWCIPISYIFKELKQKFDFWQLLHSHRQKNSNNDMESITTETTSTLKPFLPAFLSFYFIISLEAILTVFSKGALY